MTTIDRSFGADYSFELLDEAPGAGDIVRIPRRAAGNDGLLVRIVPPSGRVWVGLFAFGNFGVRRPSKLLTTPNPTRLCVIARGAGYIVDVNAPGEVIAVEAIPAVEVQSAIDVGLLVFADFTGLVAYGADGLRWKTPRLSMDGVHIKEISGSSLRGEYFDLPSESHRQFHVDLRSGVPSLDE